MPRWQKPAAIALAFFAAAYVANASAQEIGDYKFTIAQSADHNISGEGHYMVLDGRTLSAAAEPDLFAVLGHTFGGAGDDFDLPDMRGRAAVASSGALAVGTAQGAASVNLSISQLPSHDHGAGTFSAGGGGTPELFIHPGQGEDTDPVQPTGLVTSNHKNSSPSAWTSSFIRNAGGGGAVTGTSAATGSGAAISVLDPGLVIGAAFMLVDTQSRFPAGTDPHFASVVLLAPFTAVVDEDLSNSNHTLTAQGDAAISGGFLVTDGSGDAVSAPDSADWDFGSGDFTLEGFFEVGTQGHQVLIATAPGNGHNGWFWEDGPNRGPFFARDPAAIVMTNGSPNHTAAGTVFHLAMVRDGGTLRTFRDGVQIDSVSISGPVDTSDTNGLFVGGNTNLNIFSLDGKVNWVRITKGVARYTANFTPPTTPLPSS